MSERKALIGLHDKDDWRMFSRRVEDKGYTVEVVGTPEEMLKKAKEGSYDLYVMDVNLGDSMSRNFSCALKVKELIKEGVKSGAAFIPLSYSRGVVSDARRVGLEAFRKSDFQRKLDEIADNR